MAEFTSEALRERLARRPTPGRERCAAVTPGDGATLPGVDITGNAAIRGLMDTASSCSLHGATIATRDRGCARFPHLRWTDPMA